MFPPNFHSLKYRILLHSRDVLPFQGLFQQSSPRAPRRLAAVEVGRVMQVLQETGGNVDQTTAVWWTSDPLPPHGWGGGSVGRPIGFGFCSDPESIGFQPMLLNLISSHPKQWSVVDRSASRLMDEGDGPPPPALPWRVIKILPFTMCAPPLCPSPPPSHAQAPRGCFGHT